MRYVLFGESPYPRAQSANGYAFWDAAANSLWAEEGGLHQLLNRAIEKVAETSVGLPASELPTWK